VKGEKVNQYKLVLLHCTIDVVVILVCTRFYSGRVCGIKCVIIICIQLNFDSIN